MTKKNCLLLLALLLFASPMIFAQATPDLADTSQIAQQHAQWKSIAAALAAFSMAIASGLCGLAQAKAVAGSSEAIARNPGAAAAIRFGLLLGLILIESMALYTFVIIFVEVK
jgi:F-type H+-transporting ATPase subunit c